MVVNYKLYRRLCVIFGARSFVKKREGEENTYVLTKGNTRHMANILRGQGFTEEWTSGNR